MVGLRVTDANGLVAETEVIVKVGDEPETSMSAPDVTVSKDEFGMVYVVAENAPSEAKYLLMRLNGFDLGFAEIGTQMRVGELKFDGSEELSFAWLNEDYDVGNVAVVNSQDILLIESNPGGSVMTGVSLGSGGVLVAIGVMMIVALLVHKKDATRMGGRPREGP